MAKMQNETMALIYKSLWDEVENRKRAMMTIIHGGHDEHLSEYVQVYREVYKAYCDFSNFYDEVMDGD